MSGWLDVTLRCDFGARFMSDCKEHDQQNKQGHCNGYKKRSRIQALVGVGRRRVYGLTWVYRAHVIRML